MISDTARYHGAFFVLLFDHFDDPIVVEKLPQYGAGYYLLGGIVPVYLKFSKKRKGPWAFNFFRSHQETQDKLYSLYGECFTCLVCGTDGVVGLNMDELRQMLDEKFDDQESITVRRRLNKMYQLNGRDGKLENRVSRRSAFEKIRTTLLKEQKK